MHKKGKATAMTDDEFEAYLDSLDTYAQKEAQVREVLYDTLQYKSKGNQQLPMHGRS